MASLREVRWELASIWACGKIEDEIFTTLGCGVPISLLCVAWKLLAEKFAHKVIRHWETPWKMVDTNRELTQDNSSAQIMWEPLGKQILFSCLEIKSMRIGKLDKLQNSHLKNYIIIKKKSPQPSAKK